MADCYRIYTHKDLDGAVSLLTLIWAKPEKIISYKPISNLQIDELKRDIENINKPCPTFITDLSLREEFLPSLDQEHITFIDHHITSENYIKRFNKAKIFHKTTTSNALWTAQLFSKNICQERTDDQKLLIALADDYDCYRLQIPESYDLNILFWSEYKNDFNKFIKDYHNGFKPFTSQQKRAINFIKQEAIKEASTLPLFYGELNISGKIKKTLAVMSEKMSTLVMDTLIQRHSPDIMFFINSKSEKVSLRQCNSNDSIDIGALAEKLCDGGGHPMAAGGVITPLFMEVCKNLKPISFN